MFVFMMISFNFTTTVHYSIDVWCFEISNELNHYKTTFSKMNKIKWKKYLLLLSMLVLKQVVLGQQISVHGQVKDKSGTPIKGVTVKVVGKSTTLQTDDFGNFKLNDLPIGTKLFISYLGFENQEIVVKDTKGLEVVLAPQENMLDEVVAVGYGTVKKKDLTGSVSSIVADELQAFPTATIAQAMQGRAAGVQVQQNSGQPGSGIQIRIRGANSVRGDNEPLWIIDGFPGNSNMLNPSDIENIEVLKDASATAIYGSRGANGVVIVTTRKGKAGQTRVEYNGNYTVQTVRKKLDLLNAKEYMQLMNIQQKNDNGVEFFSAEDIASAQDHDWQDLLFQSAPLHDHNIAVLGGNDKTKFSLSSAVYDQKGVVRNNSFQRINVRGTIDHQISPKVGVFMNTLLNKSHSKNGYPSAGLRGGTLMSAIPGALPTVGPYLEDGSYRLLNSTYPFVSDGLINPQAYINEVSTKWMANRVILNSGIRYVPLKDLTVNIGANLTNVDSRSDDYTSSKYPESIGRASIDMGNTSEYNGSATIEYKKSWADKHQFLALVGTTADMYIARPVSLSGSGFLSDVYETDNIGSAAIINTPSSGYTKWTMLSYLGRVNYNFDERLLLTASLRADGSSRYSAKNKWGYFPSAAVAYRFSEEQFIKNLGFVNDLKLRIGYGQTGSTAIDPYYTLNMLTGSKAVFNDNLFNAFSPGNRLPANLKWETTEQTNIGIDLSILSDRVRFTADYYVKNTRDLLNAVQLPRSLGYVTTIQNIGQMENKGFELLLDTRILDSEFIWNLATNFSFNTNTVKKLYDGQDILGSTLNITILNDNLNLVREGQPMGVFYGYVEDGYTESGKIKYKDVNEDGKITTADKTYIGNPNPKFTYGFNSSMSYKNFDLSVFVQGSKGNDIYSLSMAAQTMDFGQGLNTLREVLNSNWTPDNPETLYPKISRTTSTMMSDRFVYDGSYLRLKNIQLAYNVPATWLGEKSVKRIQLYVSGQNLLTISDYPWFDPEVNTKGGGNSLNQGIDHYAYPVSKSFSFGVKVGL